MIVLPVVGQLLVAGKPLAQIERSIRDAYHPAYVKSLFPVYASVVEYKTYNVSVVGSVARPGIQALRHDQMSLVSLLMHAGGIAERGGVLITVTRQRGTSAACENSGMTSWREGPGPSEYGENFMLHRDANAVDAMRVAFSHTGPLITSGWLRIEEQGETIVRSRLDIGSMLQRARCLTALGTRPTSPSIPELHIKLAELAHHLEARAYADASDGVGVPRDWIRVGMGRGDAGVSLVDAPAGSGSGSEELRAVTETRAQAQRPTTLVLPVKGLNIPFADIALQEGDAVVVEAPHDQFVSVVGLVGRPGNFPYPPTTRYTLIQAVAAAGGLDLAADPRYVSVYRLREDGTVASTTVQLVNPKNERQLTEALSLPLKAGDVVSVEHTPRTRTNTFFDRVFRVSLGLYLNPDTLINDD
jgi:protein involved in polysaccharide export with SLBB domain